MGKGSSQSKSMSTLSSGQNKLLKTATKWLNDRIGQGAEEYSGSLVAEMPDYLKSMLSSLPAQLTENFQAGQQMLSNLSTWKPYQSNIKQVSKDYDKYVTKPVSQAVMSSLGLDTLSQYNQPGSFYSTNAKRRVGEAVSNAVSLQTAPGLASAIENERTRGFQSNENAPQTMGAIINAGNSLNQSYMGAMSGLGSLQTGYEQSKLTSAYQEFLRTSASNDPYIRLANSFIQPTMQNFWQPGTDYTALAISGGSQIAGMAAGGYLAGVGSKTPPATT